MMGHSKLQDVRRVSKNVLRTSKSTDNKEDCATEGRRGMDGRQRHWCGDKVGEHRRGARCASDTGATQKGAGDKVRCPLAKETSGNWNHVASVLQGR
uniref:Uncharacterized protein n=1 Tax=Zea mays TaxID=4577 RepID=A0A804LP51_MAIZE